jgi:riboflavin synthase
MFTGLIESIGTIKDLRRTSGAARLIVELGPIAGELALGESVSVSGACLTVVSAGSGKAEFDVVPETLERSGLGRFRPGDKVNIERALRTDSRLGGHFVQGHVDGIGKVTRVNRSAGAVEIGISAPPEVMELVVSKGSVAVDGISLTVARRDSDGFTIAVIPHTLDNTTLGSAKVGDEVNLETDILGKYVQGLLLGGATKEERGVTETLLRNAGFM